MAWFLYLMSIIYIAFGCCFILAPAETKENMRMLSEKVDRRVWASVAGVAGLLFLFSYSASSHPWIIVLVGILALVKGGVFFVNPGGIYERTTLWYYGELTEETYRIHGIAALILGTVIFCWTL
jgi:uncharacterized membrane protein HdeD (DUF308 family)